MHTLRHMCVHVSHILSSHKSFATSLVKSLDFNPFFDSHKPNSRFRFQCKCFVHSFHEYNLTKNLTVTLILTILCEGKKHMKSPTQQLQFYTTKLRKVLWIHFELV